MTSGQTYFYVVEADDSGGDSTPWNEVRVVVPTPYVLRISVTSCITCSAIAGAAVRPGDSIPISCMTQGN